MAKSLEAGKLIVGAIAVSVDPTGTAATALGIDTLLQFKTWASGKPNLQKLARDLDQKFYTELAKPRFDKPADARQLLPQMLEAAKPDPNMIAACALDADEILTAMHKVLATKGSEYSRHEIKTAFDNLLHPLLTDACNNPDLVAALSPHLTRKQMKDQEETKADVKETKEDVKGIKSMMEAFMSGASISLDDMKTLAAKFGTHDISDKASLERFLQLKAEEYRALKAEVDGIDESMKRLSNLKSAAQEAIARVDLDEVENLLAMVQEAELDEAAKTAEMRATNALLRGKVDQAYRLLCTAADSFAAIDPLEPANRRLSYEDILYQHGLRHGGDGMALSEQMIRTALSKIDRAKNSELWARAQNNLGNALANQGTRTEGQDGADLLAEAVTAYRNALEVYTENAHPVDWAMTQNNLGTALTDQGIRTEGAAGADLLAEAVTAYRDALEVSTKGAEPVRWAMTQNNLGNVLGDQGNRTAGQDGADLLSEAVIAYRSALEVRTRDAHPVDWAETHLNIAMTEEEIAEHETTCDPHPHLDAALKAVEAAQTVYDPVHLSYNHAKATRLRDHIQAKLDALPPG